MQIPSESEWRTHAWSLDLKCAYHHFHGKSLAEATKLFEENSLYYQEDLMFMPGSVFGYYVQAFINYLMSDATKDDADGASSFISLIDFKAEHQPEDIEQLWDRIEPVLKKLAESQEFYGADWFPYRSFRSRINNIVLQGFPVSFDTTAPEVVPAEVTWEWIASAKLSETFSWPVAVQIFSNAGFTEIDANSTKADILKVFGPPVAVGGNWNPESGGIPDWIQCRVREGLIRFQFDGETITSVTVQSWSDFPALAKNYSA